MHGLNHAQPDTEPPRHNFLCGRRCVERQPLSWALGVLWPGTLVARLIRG
jgi:hypothetical protein